MRIRKLKSQVLFIEGLFVVFVLLLSTWNMIVNWNEKNNLRDFLFVNFIVFAVAAVCFGIYLLVCRTFYVFKEDSLQIIKRKKILHNIAYDKIIRVEHHAFMPTGYIIELPLSYIKINYYNEKGKQKQAELYCPFRPLRKLKNFPMNKVIKL